jgi:transcriptional regulator with PAS, ATPase and Fis domain
MMTESDVIDVRDLPDRIQNTRVTENAVSEAELSMDQLARLHAHRVLAHVGGNKVRAAEILGISRTYLYELLKKSAPQEDQLDAELKDEESKLVGPKAPKGA